MGRGGKVTDTDRGWNAIKETVKQIAARGSYVKVGVLGGGSNRPGDGLSNAELAAVHEFGTLDGHIPARPFIGGTYDVKREDYVKMIRKGLDKVLIGKQTIEGLLGRVGLKFASDVKKTVIGSEFQLLPNAPETIRRKGSDVPLVDTGRLVNSVTHEVVIQEKSSRSSGPKRGR